MLGSRGFTLIELLVTMAVLGILAAMAAPSMSDLIAKQRLNSSTRELALTLSQARSQAALIRAPVAVCPSKTISNSNMSKSDCAVAVAFPNFTSMTTTQQSAILADRVLIASIDQSIYPSSANSTGVLFNHVGSISNAANFSLCKNNKERIVSVSILGTITQKEGTC